MRKLLAIIFTLAVLAVNAQKKDSRITVHKDSLPTFGAFSIKSTPPIAVINAGKDTLTLGDSTTIKAIKIGQRVVPVELLKQDGLFLTTKDLQNLVAMLQEYPAKCANPITAAVLRFFGVEPGK